MNKKLMLLALAAFSAVIFALPAVASAAEWTLSGGEQSFTASGGTTTLTTNQNETVTCSSISGSGIVNASGTTGTIHLVFHGCKEDASGTTCTGTGQPSGTTTVHAHWETVYLTDSKTKPGIKITGFGETEELGLFKCGFGLVTVRTEGSVIGEVEAECGARVREFGLNFESIGHGVQKYMQNTETGSKTDLTAYRNGVERTASMDGTGTVKSEKENTINCV